MLFQKVHFAGGLPKYLSWEAWPIMAGYRPLPPVVD
jgi:hypothetical protein